MPITEENECCANSKFNMQRTKSNPKTMPHLYRLLGQNIARFRRDAHLTQEELAEKTDYSVDFIGLVERGVNAPTVSRLKDIADVIGVKVWQLFFTDPANKRPTAEKKPHARRDGRKQRA